MIIHVVYRDGHPPEGAFETRKLATEYVRERQDETSEHGHFIIPLEVVKQTDRPAADGSDLARAHSG